MKLIAGALLGVLFLPLFTYAAPVQCECVRFLREVRGIEIRGNADTIVANTPTHQMDVGDVLLLQYGKVSHVAEIIGFEGKAQLGNMIVPTEIVVIEANMDRCKVSVRKISLLDPAIKGVYKAPPVL